MGEFLRRPPGFECVREVKLRDDGFGFMQCSYANQPYTEADYDPNDGRYSFKRLSAPAKWWVGVRDP